MKTLDGIKKLNAVKKADGELLIEAIDLKELKGAKERDLAEAFLTAIEGIPEKDEQFIPEELAELYNKLAEETVPLEEEKEVAKPAAKPAKKSEVKETAKPAAKATKKPETKPVDKKKEPEAKKPEPKKTDAKKEAAKPVVKKEEPKPVANVVEKVNAKSTGSKGMGIGAHIRKVLSTKDGKKRDNQSILDEVLKMFPGANTNKSNISWYRNDMRKKGTY